MSYGDVTYSGTTADMICDVCHDVVRAVIDTSASYLVSHVCYDCLRKLVQKLATAEE